MHADEMANSVNHDQTAPSGADWSGSTLLTQTLMSEYLGELRNNMTAGINGIC